jgi:hypothetical protein
MSQPIPEMTRVDVLEIVYLLNRNGIEVVLNEGKIQNETC